MNVKPLGLFNLINVITGLFSLGLIFSCASSEGGDESKITILMNSPEFANGTYQLDNVTLNDNGTNILYTKTTTTINTGVKWIGDELCEKFTGEREKCDPGTYQLSNSGYVILKASDNTTWSIDCSNGLTVDVLFDKDKNVVRSDNFRGNCKIIDSPFTVKPVEVTETWSNTNDGIQRVFILYDSEGVKYTRTYKYSKI